MKDLFVDILLGSFQRSDAAKSLLLNKYRRTQEPLKAESSQGQRLNRANTMASTVPSIYSPSPAPTPHARSKSVKKFGTMPPIASKHVAREQANLWSPLETPDAVMSAADHARASKRRPPPTSTGTEVRHWRDLPLLGAALTPSV